MIPPPTRPARSMPECRNSCARCSPSGARAKPARSSSAFSTPSRNRPGIDSARPSWSCPPSAGWTCCAPSTPNRWRARTLPTANSNSWCSSVTTSRKSARRRNCATSSCPARGAPVCRSPKSAAPPRWPAGMSHGFRRHRRRLGHQRWLGGQGAVRARPEDAADRARSPRRAQDRLPGFRHALGSAESRHGRRRRNRRALCDPEPVSRLQLRQPSNGGCATANIPTRRPTDRPFSWIRGYHLGGRSHHLGTPDLSHERPSTSAPTRKDGHGSTGRSATRISRPGTTASNASPASPARTKAWSSCPTGISCRRWSSTASSARSRSDRNGPPDAARDRRPLRASHRAHARAHRARPRTLPVAQRLRARLRLRRVFLIAVRHAAGGAEDRQPDHRHRRHRRAPRLRPCEAARVRRARDRLEDGAGQVLPGARGVPVRLDHRHRADPARVDARSISQRTREPLGRRGPVSHGPCRWASARTAPIPASSIATTTAAGRRASTCRATSTSPRRTRRLHARLCIPGLLGSQQLDRARSTKSAWAPELKQRLRDPGAGRCS